jgi:hypothetical protein
MEKVLLKTKEYSGMYVAIEDPNNTTVIAYGQNPADVYMEAQKKGFEAPTIVYVPAEESVHIY